MTLGAGDETHTTHAGLRQHLLDKPTHACLCCAVPQAMLCGTLSLLYCPATCMQQQRMCRMTSQQPTSQRWHRHRNRWIIYTMQRQGQSSPCVFPMLLAGGLQAHAYSNAPRKRTHSMHMCAAAYWPVALDLQQPSTRD
jgi:hypothetical protein